MIRKKIENRKMTFILIILIYITIRVDISIIDILNIINSNFKFNKTHKINVYLKM